MIKKSVIYLILSFLIVYFASDAHWLIVYIDIIFTQTNLIFAPFFSSTPAGILVREVIVLTLLPVAITAIPTLLYRAIRGQLMPYYYELTWLIWLTIVMSKIIIV